MIINNRKISSKIIGVISLVIGILSLIYYQGYTAYQLFSVLSLFIICFSSFVNTKLNLYFYTITYGGLAIVQINATLKTDITTHMIITSFLIITAYILLVLYFWKINTASIITSALLILVALIRTQAFLNMLSMYFNYKIGNVNVYSKVMLTGSIATLAYIFAPLMIAVLILMNCVIPRDEIGRIK